MAADVKPFIPVSVGETYRFDPDVILDNAKGGDFTILAVMAQYPDGSVYVTSNANLGETLVLMERAKHHLVFGDDTA